MGHFTFGMSWAKVEWIRGIRKNFKESELYLDAGERIVFFFFFFKPIHILDSHVKAGKDLRANLALCCQV